MNPSFASKADEVFSSFGSVAYCAQIFEADLVTMVMLIQRVGRLDSLLKDQLNKDPFRLLNRRGVDAFLSEAGGAIENELSKNTLGFLLKNDLSRAQKNLRDMTSKETSIVRKEILEEIIETLDAIPLSKWELAHKRRDYLFHEFFFRHEMELCNDTGCRILLDKLGDDKTLFENCVIQVRSFTRKLLKVLGMDEETFSLAVSIELKRLFCESHLDAAEL